MNRYIVVLVICILVQKLAFADDESFTYELTSLNEATITGCYKRCPLSIRIPDKIDGYTITSVGVKAFSNAGLRSVTFPTTLVRIDSSSFFGNELTEVAIPDTVLDIGDAAFAFNKLRSIALPTGLTTIGAFAFRENKLASLVIPKGVVSIGDGAFLSNSLTSLIISENVLTIGESSFANNLLTSLSIPNNVVSLGARAFSRNNLVEVIISNPNMSIGFNALPYELTIKEEKKGLSEGMIAKAEGRYSEALEIFRELSSTNLDAKIQLAQMYEYGQGSAINTPLAIEYYEQIVEHGGWFSHKAARIIGDLHFNGASDHPRNLGEALSWYERSAELGSVRAATKLSQLYLDDEEEYFNVNRGIKYLKLNAARSHSDSMVTLAMLYYEGEKVNQNHALALEILLKASDLGHAYARYAIGVLYSDGKGGVPDNLTEAFMWFIIASVTGYENAAGAIMQLKPNMTTMQIRKAQDDASRCAEYDYVGC